MFKGDWSRYNTLGLIAAAILFAAAAAIWIYEPASRSEALYQREAKQRAENYADRANVTAANRCPDVSPTELTQCQMEEYHAARADQREEYDLEAQRTMAVWTRAMGLAAIVAMAVGVVGVGLIFVTFRETRRTAKATEDALVLTAQTSAADLRPYLFIDKLELERDERDSITVFHVAVVFRNYGKLPARAIQVRTDCYFTDDIAALNPRVLDEEPVPIPVCAHGHERRTFTGTVLSSKNREDLRAGFGGVVVRVRYRYKGNGKKIFAERADYVYDFASVNRDIFFLLTPYSRQRRSEHRKDLLDLMNAQSDESEGKDA